MDGHDWQGSQRRPQPTAWLVNARCHRCGPLSDRLPVDKVRILCYPRGYNLVGRTRHMRVFLCPSCRTDVWQWVDATEALRLFANGVSVRRYTQSPDEPLTEEEVNVFAESVHQRTDLARLALDS